MTQMTVRRASVWFGGFVMAAASAVDGRDALIFTPSIPVHASETRDPAPFHRPQAALAGDRNRQCRVLGDPGFRSAGPLAPRPRPLSQAG